MNQVTVFGSLLVRYSLVLAIVGLVTYLLVRLYRENKRGAPDIKTTCNYCGAAMLESDIRCPSCGGSS